MSATTDRISSRSIDHYIPDDVRAILEERFWHTVEENSTLEAPAPSSLPTSRTAVSCRRGQTTAGSSWPPSGS
jgi:hypothetical protein